MPSELTLIQAKENNVSLFGSHGENDLEKNLPEVLTCRLRRVKRRAIADLPDAEKNPEPSSEYSLTG